MKRLCMWLIGLYRRYLSPLKPCPTCRFTPTCSAYAYEAFEKRGFFAGFALMIWRLLRCSPLSPGGFDPVPETGFRTMPMRWSRYDKYLAENAARRTESQAVTPASADGGQAPSDGPEPPDAPHPGPDTPAGSQAAPASDADGQPHD